MPLSLISFTTCCNAVVHSHLCLIGATPLVGDGITDEYDQVEMSSNGLLWKGFIEVGVLVFFWFVGIMFSRLDDYRKVIFGQKNVRFSLAGKVDVPSIV